MSEYTYTPTIQHSGDDTPYRLITTDGIRVEQFNGKDVLVVEKDVLERLAYEAFYEVSFFLRPGHMQQVAKILDDPAASENDIFVAKRLGAFSSPTIAVIIPLCWIKSI